MDIKNLLVMGAMSVVLTINAQVTDRPRPAEWKNLVKGGRYMDRFLPMEEGKKGTHLWGCQDVQNRYVDNGIESADFSFWGGNILKMEDGKYHLFVCGWPENSPKGHMFWPNSTVFHAVSDKMNGPFQIKDSIGKGHNPEAFVLEDGRIVLYVIGGYYIADKPEGPWAYRNFDFDRRDRNIIEGLSNLTFAPRQDDSRLMICRGGGVWISQTGVSPYYQLTDKRVYPPVEGKFEDPVVWRDSLQYHMIVNDWLGRIAWYLRSKDGLHWVTEPGEAYVPGVSFHKDGTVENWFKYERAKVFQDEQGRVSQMNFAVIDTIKWEDHPNDTHSSKNICIPMNKGLLLNVLNRKPITDKTSKIEVRVQAEKDFNPQSDLDLGSLRFGSYEEVNYGRGSKVIKTRKDGNDLILIFNGTGSGIGEEEFAPKLIGKNQKGEMVFGYASLPYVNYKPALLSARKPIYKKENGQWQIEVQNFGLSSSSETDVDVYCEDKLVGKGKVQALQPYEKEVLTLNTQIEPTQESSRLKVIFSQKGKVLDTNNF